MKRLLGVWLAVFSALSPGLVLETWAAPKAPPAKSSGQPAVDDGVVARRLRAAVAETESKLGELEAWQKRIFEDEALPQYQRFIRNYRSGQAHSGTAVSSLEVDIDVDSLKNYIKFYAPKTLGRDEKTSQVLIYLRSESTCEKCVAAGPAIRKIVQMRVDRRGLSPVWLSADDLGVGSDGKELAGKALNERVASIAQARNAAAVLVIQWGPAPVDDVDTAHADEKHFLLQTWVQARGLGGTGKLSAAAQNIALSTGSADLLELDSFEVAAGKLLADAFVDLGAQAQKAEQTVASRADGGFDDSEIDVVVSGTHDFATYSKLKAQVQGKITAAAVEERKIARGHVVLALMGSKVPIENLRSQLIGLQIDPAAPLAGKLAALDHPVDQLGGPSPASSDATPVIALEIRQ